MPEVATPPVSKPSNSAELLNYIKERDAKRDAADAERDKKIDELIVKSETPAQGPYGIINPIGSDSGGYSVMKMAAYAAGMDLSDPPKYELDCHEKLINVYKSFGWKTTNLQHCRSFLVPYSTSMIPRISSESERMVGELKYKMIAGANQVDPNEVAWLHKRMSQKMVQKDLGTVSDAAGGVLVGFPELAELIDMQRNEEAFNRAGATERALPPNGRIQFPKLANSTTAFWVGEGSAITESTPATGYLDLQAKKLGIFVDLNNELIRFNTISSEAMVRTDMAKVAALKMDLAQLEGTGGTQIKGLITYPSASSWTPGTDPLLTFSVTSNLIQVSDAAEMEAIMPDTAGEPTAWVMRRQMFAKIRNRRADGASFTDGRGPYLPNITRSLAERLPYQWDGTPVVRTSQVSATRGAGTNTYVVLGYFPDWITARFGVLEFLSSMVGDTQMTNDQTRIRCIQHVDAGPRHASSFVFADDISIA